MSWASAGSTYLSRRRLAIHATKWSKSRFGEVFVSFVEGTDRGQVSLLPACVDDYVTPDALVRVVDGFVASLNLTELGFSRTVAAAPAAPASIQATCFGSTSGV